MKNFTQKTSKKENFRCKNGYESIWTDVILTQQRTYDLT